MNVLSVEAKGEKAGIIVTDDGQRIWTPEKATADALVGKPIPPDWTIKQGEYGPQAFPPRDKKGFGGGAAAFRNTREGMLAEQESIHRSVALTQAVVFISSGEAPAEAKPLELADRFYHWLSQSPPRDSHGTGASSTVVPHKATPVPHPPAADEGRGRKAQNRAGTEGGSPPPATEQGKLGEGEPAPSGVCAHEHTSPLKPDGAPLPHGFLRCLGCGVVHKEAS